MELRTLRYFLTVANEQNITRASEILHITQPTLSRQLMQLEEELKVKLFYRGKRKITLTKSGMLLRKRAEEILNLVDKTEKELGSQNLITGTISIGSVESVQASESLSRIIKIFHEKYPQVNFNIYSGNAADIKEKINNGLIDIGVLLTPVDYDVYNHVELPQKENWGVLMQKSSSLAEQNCIAPKDLIGLPIIISNRPAVQNYLSTWFGEFYNDLNILAEYNLIYNAAVLVKKGLGHAICLESVLSIHESDNICFRPFSPELTSNCLFVWKKSQTINYTVSHFIQFIENIYGKNNHS